MWWTLPLPTTRTRLDLVYRPSHWIYHQYSHFGPFWTLSDCVGQFWTSLNHLNKTFFLWKLMFWWNIFMFGENILFGKNMFLVTTWFFFKLCNFYFLLFILKKNIKIWFYFVKKNIPNKLGTSFLVTSSFLVGMRLLVKICFFQYFFVVKKF